MSAHRDETQELGAELRLWEQAHQRRDLVLAELTQRLMRQTERDNRLLSKLAAARARLDVADRAWGSERAQALA
jgi:hypothetical protein